ncbi:MAG TPA: PEP/pyruvate-binding domain-containing protein [Candidatus Limnocylindrales bacterium]
MSVTVAISLPIHGRGRPVALPPDAGGKASGLERISASGLPTAPWFVVPASARPGDALAVDGPLAAAIADACHELMRGGVGRLAVRSSGLDEDGAACSFAGQYLTVLDVPDVTGVLEAIVRCWKSADTPSVRAYRAAAGRSPESPGMAVIVQAMVPAATAGVAISDAAGLPARPASSDDPSDAVVVAIRGVGAPLVSGAVGGDEYRVGRDGSVVVRQVDPGPQPCLADTSVRAIADAARRLADTAGAAQDVEWAITADGDLSILQTRAVTGRPLGDEPGARGAVPPDGATVRVWDNANIVESFSGVTLPLTFSVAREAYAAVYRGACRSLGVSEGTLEAEADVFEQMLGHIDGRVYYNVSSWHRVLSLLPGFGASQPLLERMMGAAKPAGRAGERAEAVVAQRPDLGGLARFGLRSGSGLLLFERRARALERTIRDLATQSRANDVESMSIEQLLDQYDEIRRRALAGWHVTIFNDLAVMVVHGALRRAAERWLGPDADPIVNGLLRTDALASTAPATELRQIAARLRDEPAWIERLDCADDPLGVLRSDPSLADLRRRFDAYIDRWGDRCPSELQLDRLTFREDPGPVLLIIRALAAGPDAAVRDSLEPDRPAAWADLTRVCLGGPGPRRAARLRVLRSLVEMTRYRLRWRERMRFGRTEVFAIGRRLFRAMDRRLLEAGVFERPGDLHYLDIAEIRGAIRGTLPSVGLRAIVEDRRARFERFRIEPAPASRFETSGPVLLGSHDASTRVAAVEPGRPGAAGTTLVGTAVCAGIVRGPCRPIDDPRGIVPRPGEIVAARSTDPGWVPTLLAAGGLLVERGSLLSHSAIVARELRLPTIVGIGDLMSVVEPGQIAHMDGSSGVVRLEPLSSLPSTPMEPGP